MANIQARRNSDGTLFTLTGESTLADNGIFSGIAVNSPYQDADGTFHASGRFPLKQYTFVSAPQPEPLLPHFPSKFTDLSGINALLIASEEAGDELDIRIEYVDQIGQRTVRNAVVYELDDELARISTSEGPRNFRRDGIVAVSV